MENIKKWSSSRVCLLFNIYISDMPETKSKKLGYANDLALAIDVDTYETKIRH